MAACGIDIDDLRAHEVEPGLGNGGLGRLAACFIDSLATLGVPNIGYGIRYEYGIFRQTFEDGQQVEQPDSWLKLGSPWEFPTPRRRAHLVRRPHRDLRRRGDPHTLGAGVGRPRRPVQLHGPGYLNGRVNTLRLWSAKATNSFDLRVFNSGDYEEAVRAQTFAENISKVLYPEDSTPQGKELRLQQQYFFVAASIGDFLESLPEDFDLTSSPTASSSSSTTPPVIGVPELMRVLVDEKRIEWDAAWAITQQCFAYTCHTLLPEALEVWSVDLLGRLLPRHLEIIYRINEEFLAEVRERFGDDEMRIRNMSIIGEFPDRSVRMAYLATVAGAKVNGVAELHSQLLARQGAAGLQRVLPGQVHERHERRHAAPLRAAREPGPVRPHHRGDRHRVGDRPRALRELEAYAEDPQFRAAFAAVKAANKRRLGDTLRARDGVEISDGHMLDVMVKRLHEYKRQMLKLLHIVTSTSRSFGPRRGIRHRAAHRRLRRQGGPGLPWPSASSTSSTRSERSSTPIRASRGV
jgi:starch phosphorylase